MTTRARKIEVDTREYANTYGHHPYASWRGIWAFVLVFDGREGQVRLGGTYRLALREAKRLAKEAGAGAVKVMP